MSQHLMDIRPHVYAAILFLRKSGVPVYREGGCHKVHVGWHVERADSLRVLQIAREKGWRA